MYLDANILVRWKDPGVSVVLWYEYGDSLTRSHRSVQFYGIIPGGQCFPLSEGPFTTVSGYGYGFECTVPVQAGTTVLLIGGDSRGIGTGGWAPMVVEQSNSQSCLDSSSPSSTPGSPAGSSPTSSSGVYSTSPSGVYPTSSSGVGNNTVNGGNGSSRNYSSR